MYDGPNDKGQQVFTWVASTNTTTFSGDLSPGIKYLWQNGFVPENNFLGVVQFGTETLHATEYVTFTASNIGINVTMGTTGAAKKSMGISRRKGKGNGILILAGLMLGGILLC